MRFIIYIFILSSMLSGVELGKSPKVVELQKWSSNSLDDGKIDVVFYVDPDEKGMNEAFSTKLEEENFSNDDVQRIAIINLASTWKPDFIIESFLSVKQEKFPQNIYLKDKNSLLVKKWKIADNSSDILIFSKRGKLLFYKAGKLSTKEIEQIVQMIKEKVVSF